MKKHSYVLITAAILIANEGSAVSGACYRTIERISNGRKESSTECFEDYTKKDCKNLEILTKYQFEHTLKQAYLSVKTHFAVNKKCNFL